MAFLAMRFGKHQPLVRDSTVRSHTWAVSLIKFTKHDMSIHTRRDVMVHALCRCTRKKRKGAYRVTMNRPFTVFHRDLSRNAHYSSKYKSI